MLNLLKPPASFAYSKWFREKVVKILSGLDLAHKVVDDELIEQVLGLVTCDDKSLLSDVLAIVHKFSNAWCRDMPPGGVKQKSNGLSVVRKRFSGSAIDAEFSVKDLKISNLQFQGDSNYFNLFLSINSIIIYLPGAKRVNMGRRRMQNTKQIFIFNHSLILSFRHIQTIRVNIKAIIFSPNSNRMHSHPYISLFSPLPLHNRQIQIKLHPNAIRPSFSNQYISVQTSRKT